MRLREKIPHLESLALYVEERTPRAEGPVVRYIRRIVVERAPALFVIPCSEKGCRGGGHDLTRRILRALRSGKSIYSGTDSCEGHIEEDSCELELSFEVRATYS